MKMDLQMKIDLLNNIEITNENMGLKNIEMRLNEMKQKAKDYQQSTINAFLQNKNYENEFIDLKTEENKKQSIVKNNQILLSEIKINLKLAQEKYDVLVKEKDIQFKNTSKKISELANINTTSATTLMKQLGMKLKLNHIENNIWEVKYIFNNNNEIILHYNVFESIFSLESMTPTPVKFNIMKEFLNSTQDINGFLFSSNKYFLKLHNQN